MTDRCFYRKRLVTLKDDALGDGVEAFNKQHTLEMNREESEMADTFTVALTKNEIMDNP